MGVLREELRRNLMNAGAVLVGYASLAGNEKLPYPALTQAVSYAVRLEPADGSVWAYARAYFEAGDKVELLAEHVKACLRRYGFAGEVMPKAYMDGETPVTEFPDQTGRRRTGGTQRRRPDDGAGIRRQRAFRHGVHRRHLEENGITSTRDPADEKRSRDLLRRRRRSGENL